MITISVSKIMNVLVFINRLRTFNIELKPVCTTIIHKVTIPLYLSSSPPISMTSYWAITP